MWSTPIHTFRCGVCGTTVTGIITGTLLSRVMADHAVQCKGFAPSRREKVGAGNGDSRATDGGVTPAEKPRERRNYGTWGSFFD